MATVDIHGPHEAPHEHEHEVRQTTKEWVAGGSAVEALGGIAAVVLSIVGLALANTEFTRFLAAIAAIAVGVALFCEGAAVAARVRHLLHTVAADGRRSQFELAGGMRSELLGGVAGIVLGILALLNVAPVILLAAAAIAMGATMMLGSGAAGRLNRLPGLPTYPDHETFRWAAREAAEGAAGAQVLAGLAAVVLGIIALVGLVPMTLVLVAFLCLGGSALLSGGALAERMFSVMTR